MSRCMKNYCASVLFFARDSSVSLTLNFFNSSCNRASPVAMICAARMPALRRAVDGDRGHRHARRHLHHGQQRIQPVRGFAQNRHADDRQRRERRRDARQMRRAARAADEDFHAARRCAGNIFFQPARIAVRGNDFGFADAMPNSASASAAAFIIGQSESLPIKMPTRGELVLLMNLLKWFLPLRKEISNAAARMQRLHATGWSDNSTTFCQSSMPSLQYRVVAADLAATQFRLHLCERERPGLLPAVIQKNCRGLRLARLLASAGGVMRMRSGLMIRLSISSAGSRGRTRQL